MANNANWDGSPTTLDQYDAATIPNPPNGSTVLGWQNNATQNNDGSLLVGSQGASKSYDAPALANAPSILAYNWGAQQVTATNMSAGAATPIMVEMYGPGMPGITPLTLTVGTALTLPVGQCAQGQVNPTSTVLLLTASGSDTTIVAFVGGPNNADGTNAYVYGLNMASPPPSPTPYTKTTSGRTLTTNTFNWGSATVYVANMSSANAGPLTVRLLSVG
jgi:hypothetical protein